MQQLPHLSDEELQWDYLNYLKWTEPVALMLGMLDKKAEDKKAEAIRVIKLSLAVDVRLGARLAGELEKDWQREAVELIWKLNLPQLFSIELLGITRSFYAIIWLIIILEKSQSNINNSTVESLGKNDEEIISCLGEAIKNSKPDVPNNILSALYKINEREEIAGLFEMLKEIKISVTVPSVTIEVYMSIIGGDATIIDPNQDCSIPFTIPESPPISELIRAMENSEPNIRRKATRELCELICSEKQDPELINYLKVIPKLIQAINDPSSSIDDAANALVEISSEEIIPQLNNYLKNSDWVISNHGNTFYKSIEVLDAIQNNLKYYHPLPKPPMSQQIYISYNWQEDSNEMANQLVQAFEARGIEIIRDKTHTTYKDSIKNFMQQIGQGKCVIAVISDSYLKSETCMFELVEIARNGDFYDRIFPLVLKDARIYKATERLRYIQYWEGRIQELETAMKSGGLANLQGITDDLNLYTEIRNRIASLTDILKDMNTLTPDLLRESEFAAMIQAVEAKLAEDVQNIPNPTGKTSSSSSTIVQHFHGSVYGVAGNVEGNLQINPNSAKIEIDETSNS